MINKKNINLNKSQLIDLICETVLEVSNINEAIEDKHNPIGSSVNPLDKFSSKLNPKNQEGSNHYIDEEPDEGWDEFWLDFNGDDVWQDLNSQAQMKYAKTIVPHTPQDNKGNYSYGGRMPLSDEEFLEKYGKSREDFKVDLREEVVRAKNNAIAHYKELYHPDNETVVEKIITQLYGEYNSDGVTRYVKEILKTLQGRLDEIKKYKEHTLVHFSKKDVQKVGGQSAAIPGGIAAAWGWVWGHVTGPDVYNMNLYNFTRPGLGSWKEKIYSTTIHELGHVIENLLDEYGVEAYQDMEDQGIGFKDKDYNTARQKIEDTTLDVTTWKKLSSTQQESWGKSLNLDVHLINLILHHIKWEKYLQKDSESYARLQQLRRVFGFTRNTGDPSAKEWVNMWMEKVNNEEITIGNEEQIGKQLYIPTPGLTRKQRAERWDGWHYRCAIQTFLLKHNYSVGSKERKNGKEVCDSGFGSKSIKALTDFYKNMWSRSISGTRVFITIPNEMVKWAIGVEKPRSYDELNDLTRKIFYNGEKKGDISTLLAKTAWDSEESGSKSEENYELVLDFNEIAYYNEIFVDTNSDLYLQYDDEEELKKKGLEIDKNLRQI